MGKLKGKTAFISGGNSGIGYAAAQLFLSEGAQVIITGRRENAINEAVQKLGKGATGIVSDAGDMKALKDLFKKVSAITSSIDVIFANAGVFHFTPFAETTEESFDADMNINFKGLFFTVQQLLPLIREGGAVILNATILTKSGLAGSTVYSASKGAVLSLTKTLAVELSEKKIRVNAISPGPIDTPIYSKLGLPEEVVTGFATSVQEKIPLKRFGSSDEVAKAALFLASPDSNFMTGAEIVVDGGKTIAF